MLTWLLATEPTTSPDALARIVAHPHASPAAVTAALTHPAYPADAPLPAKLHQLTSLDVHTLLTHPAISTTRRHELLSAIADRTWYSYVAGYTTLTTDEIVTYHRQHAIPAPSVHHSLLRNPRTPTELTTTALALVSFTDYSRGAALALHTHRHHFPIDWLRTLPRAGTHVTFRRYLDDYASAGRTAIEFALDLNDGDLMDTITANPHPELMVEALQRDTDVHMRAVIIGGTTPDAQYDPVRRALGHPQPGQRLTPEHIDALAKSNAFLRSAYLPRLTDPDLTPDDLTAIANHLRTTTGALTARNRALATTAAHPRCPTHDRATILSLLDQAPTWPGNDAPTTEEVIARTLHAGQIPTTDIALPNDHSAGRDTTAHHMRRALRAGALPWPLNPDATSALLELEPEHTGTLTDLHATAAGIGA